MADGALNPGSFYTGLTGDDVGGLRYLLITNNINDETLLPGTHGVGANAGSFVNEALRRGVDKITFVRVNLDPMSGQLFTPFTNQFTDSFISNGVPAHQIARARHHSTGYSLLGRRPEWRRFAGAFGRQHRREQLAGVVCLPGLAGPGIVRPQVKISFVFPSFQVQTSDAWLPGTAYNGNLSRGSFDGSTNPPVIYPAGTLLVNTNQLTVYFSLVGPECRLVAEFHLATPRLRWDNQRSCRPPRI